MQPNAGEQHAEEASKPSSLVSTVDPGPRHTKGGLHALVVYKGDLLAPYSVLTHYSRREAAAAQGG